MVIIKDGTGSGREVAVDIRNRLCARSLTESEAEGATDVGDSYNINTGTIALTSSDESAVLYLKNNEDRNLVVTGIAVGIGSAGTVTESAIVTVVRNPTAGTIVTDATSVDMNQNRNFGSNKLLTADVYKGAEAKTFTDGDDFAQFFQASGGRLFTELIIELTKGDSIGIVLDTNTSSGSTDIYAAIICHLKEE